MYVWKFRIGSNQRVKVEDPNVAGELHYSGCVAAALSETEEGARAAIKRYCNENGMDSRWLDSCDNNGPDRGRVLRLDPVEGTICAVAMI